MVLLFLWFFNLRIPVNVATFNFTKRFLSVFSLIAIALGRKSSLCYILKPKFFSRFMLHSLTAVIVTNSKHYLIWNKPILIFIFKCKCTAVHFQMTPVYESILRYIINRGVCKTSNDLSGVFSFFFSYYKSSRYVKTKLQWNGRL